MLEERIELKRQPVQKLFAAHWDEELHALKQGTGVEAVSVDVAVVVVGFAVVAAVVVLVVVVVVVVGSAGRQLLRPR